jgi:colicin import membrane protein
MEALSVISLVVGIVAGLAGIGFGLYELKSKRNEQARADRAEQAQDQMAVDLAAAREELAGTREAQEVLAQTEVADARRRKLSDRRAASALKRHRSKVEKVQAAERKAAEKATKDQAKANKAAKEHQKKMQKEAAALRKADERARREAQRRARRKR